MTTPIDDRHEWLETDGRGGFASGTTSGVRTRRYHALLLPATTPPTGRVVLVNGFDAWVDTAAGTVALSSQRYAPDVRHPDGATRIRRFSADPWPTWAFDLPDGSTMRQEICVERLSGRTVVVWSRTGGTGEVALRVRPFLSGRDYHGTHHENGAFRFDPATDGARVTFRPYDGVPGVTFLTDGQYAHGPEWYRNFLYVEEQERGLDATEDLASPGTFSWTLEPGQPASLAIGTADDAAPSVAAGVTTLVEELRATERERRAAFATPLERAADDYLVTRGRGRTIVAGYPWFTDWGRDTFIALRGLCLSTGRLAEARDILVEWAGAVSDGMLPNRFADQGEAPEYNSVDASLWYVVAVGELVALAADRPTPLDPDERARLDRAVLDIVAGYRRGTRYGIRMDDDGLLAAGVPGVQLTWMDAKIGDYVVTPRIGKPVEVQALWLNALQVAAGLDPSWAPLVARARQSFEARFWDDARGYLADVVDVDHVPGTVDGTLRPNQILAIGGLPLPLISGDRAARVVAAVESSLLTPLGLRSLAPDAPGYAGRYEGNGGRRDSVYHQGTVWPWLLGPFVDAWLRVHGDTAVARRDARRRFLAPLLTHVEAAGLGHVSEIADGDEPFTPRGCPFQAWSLGELIRIDRATAPANRQTTAGRAGTPRPATGRRLRSARMPA